MNSLNTLVGKHKQARSTCHLESQPLFQAACLSHLILLKILQMGPQVARFFSFFCNLHSLCFESTHAINSIALALSLPNGIPRSRWHTQQFNHAANGHQLPSNLHLGHWEANTTFKKSRKESVPSGPVTSTRLGISQVSMSMMQIICGTAQMTLGMNPMQHCNQPQTCLRDIPNLLGHIFTDVYINNYNYHLSKIVRFFNKHINSTGFTTRVSAVEALRRTELSAQQLLQHPFHLNHPRLTLHKNCHYRNATDAPLQRCWLQQTSHLRRQSAIKASKTSIICSWVDFSTGPTLFFLTHA